MPEKPSPIIPPVLVLAFGVLAVSTASPMIRYAQVEAHSLVIAAWRMGLSAMILAPAVLGRRRELAGLSRTDRLLGLLSGVFLAVHFASWISSLAYTTVASSVVLVDTAPLWVALMSPFLLKEGLSRRVKLGLVLAVGGGVIVALSDSCMLGVDGPVCPSLGDLVRGRAFFGNILALIGAISAAVYLIIGRRVRARLSLLSYIFVVYGSAAIVLVAVALAARQPMTGFSLGIFGWLLGLALIPQLLGHSSYNWALGYLPAAFVSLALLGEPIGSTVLAALFLGEVPSALKLAGAGLILTGIAVASSVPGGEDDSHAASEPDSLND